MAHVCDALRIETVCWLVKDKYFGIAENSVPDTETLLHSERETLVRLFAVFKTDDGENSCDLLLDLLVRNALSSCVVLKIIPCGKVAVKVRAYKESYLAPV